MPTREPRSIRNARLQPRTADPSRFAETKGREIAGLPVVVELFTPLERGRDYDDVDVNLSVHGGGDPSSYLLFVNPTQGTLRRFVKPPHWRTVSTEDVGTITVVARLGAEKRTGYFYVVSTKGVGFLKPSAEGISVDYYDSLVTQRGFQKVLGLVPEGDVRYPTNIMTRSMQLFEQGMRCEVYWAIADLKAVPFKGEVTPIETLQQKGVIPDDGAKYCQALRVLKDNDRVAEATEAADRRGEIFAKAFAVFNKEAKDAGLDFPELDATCADHHRTFFQEFFRRMGANLGVLVENGMRHYHMHSANVTMAAEIVDIESCKHWKDLQEEQVYSGVREMHIKDMRDMAYCLKRLLSGAQKNGIDCGDRKGLIVACLHGFDSAISAETLKRRQQTDPKKARQWLEAILTKVVFNDERLPALNNVNVLKADGNPFTVNDWGLNI